MSATKMFLAAGISGMALAAMGFTTMAAADDVTLRVGHRWAANHYIQTELVDPWMEAVKERSGGSVSFELYPAGQLGADVPGTIHAGLLDVGVISAGVHSDIFPLTSVGELPQAAATSCEGSARIGALVKPGGMLDEAEWASNGFHVVAANMLAPYGFFARGYPVNSLKDVKGRKVWASNPAAEVVITALGAVPLRIPSTELYDSAMRGTVDAAIFPYAGMLQYELTPILNSTVNGVNFGSGVFMIAFSENAWESLDDSQRQIIEEEAGKAERAFCEYIDSNDDDQRATVAAQEGFISTNLEGESLAEFEHALENVAQTWADTFERAGRPGKAVLDAYRAVEVE